MTTELATLRHLALRHIGITQEQRKAVRWALGMIGAGVVIEPEPVAPTPMPEPQAAPCDVRTVTVRAPLPLPYQLRDILVVMVEEEAYRHGYTLAEVRVRRSHKRGAIGRGLLARGLTIKQAAAAMGCTYESAKVWCDSDRGPPESHPGGLPGRELGCDVPALPLAVRPRTPRRELVADPGPQAWATEIDRSRRA